MAKIKAEFNVSFKAMELTSKEAEIEVLDEEEGNKFLLISLMDKEDASKKATIITSTDALKRIIKAVERGWKQLLEDAIDLREEMNRRLDRSI